MKNFKVRIPCLKRKYFIFFNKKGVINFHTKIRLVKMAARPSPADVYLFAFVEIPQEIKLNMP